jgi:hypothetical protein
MQKQFTSFVLAILFGWMLGCNSNPVHVPDQNSVQVSPAGQKVQLLELPGTAGMNLAKKSSASGSISPDSGGQLEVVTQFQTATLTVPKNAVKKGVDISMAFDDCKAQISFGPEGLQFKKDAMLNYTAAGLDLSSVPVGTVINLYYYNETTGAYEQMSSESITYDKKAGTLTCVNGDIPHFCIYAFGYIKR